MKPVAQQYSLEVKLMIKTSTLFHLYSIMTCAGSVSEFLVGLVTSRTGLFEMALQGQNVGNSCLLVASNNLGSRLPNSLG